MKVSSDKYFVIIAGPNGAGKSFASKTYLEQLGLPISAFNWDERFLKLWGEFGFDPYVSNGVREKINTEFEVYIKSHLNSGLHIAYESNFHLHYNIELISQAKTIGYSVVLYFLYLESVEIAVSRVNLRVKMGGHAVSLEDINERYTNGFKQLNVAIPLCDHISIFDYSIDFDPKLILVKSQDEINIHRKIPFKLYNNVTSLKSLEISPSMVSDGL